MSNTESVRQNGVGTNPIHSSPLAKLRSIRGGGGFALPTGAAEAANWLDAFSEVFARMAVSDATPEVTTVTPDQSETQVESDVNASADDTSQNHDQDIEQASSNDALADETFVPENPVAAVEVSEVESDVVEYAEPLTAVQQVTEDTGPVVDEETVEPESVVIADVQPQAVDVATPAQVASTIVTEQGHEKNHGKSQQEIPVSIESGSELGDDDSITKQIDPVGEVNAEAEPADAATTTAETDGTENESRRRTKHGRQGRLDPSSEGHLPIQRAADRPIKSSGGIPIPLDLEGSVTASQSSATTAEASTADRAAKPQVAVAAAVQAAAKVASSAGSAVRAAASTAPTGLTGNIQTPGRPGAPAADTHAKKTTDPSKPSSANEIVNRAKLIQRVSKAFQHLGPEGGHVRLRLAPAELGTIRIEMRMNERRIQARVVAQSEAAGSALREHLPELRQRLETQGLQIERFQIEVETGDQETRSFLGQHHESGGQRGREGSRDWSHSSSGDGVSPAVSRSVSLADQAFESDGGTLPTIVDGGMDVRL